MKSSFFQSPLGLAMLTTGLAICIFPEYRETQTANAALKDAATNTASQGCPAGQLEGQVIRLTSTALGVTSSTNLTLHVTGTQTSGLKITGVSSDGKEFSVPFPKGKRTSADRHHTCG